MYTVTFLLLPNALTSSITLPLEMLNAAKNIESSRIANRSELKIMIAGKSKKAITTTSGITITPSHRLDQIKGSDFIFIPSLWRNPATALRKNNHICDWLRVAATPNTKICAVGTGSIFLAESNLIYHKAATSHWFYLDLMERMYPDVIWKRNHLITQSDNIYCAGSINSVADLTIHFIEQMFGNTIAKRVESQFSPEIRQAYQSQLFDDSLRSTHPDELIAEVQNHILRNFNESIDFNQLSSDLQIAYRTLQRRFKAATGDSLLKYQQRLRVANAQELLKNTNLNIQEISESVGIVDASHFSKVFKQFTQQTPNTYRKSVRGKLFSS